MERPPDRLTLVAFVLVVAFGGANAVAIRIGNVELPPFWGASLRFLFAALVLAVLALLLRRRPPSRTELRGIAMYGLFNFFGSYALAYWALQEARAGPAQVVIAAVPLLTILLARAQGLERVTRRGLGGAALAALGVVFLFSDQLGSAVPPAPLPALLGAAVVIAQGAIIAKRSQLGDPYVANAIAMAIGGGFLLGLSVLAGESRSFPSSAPALASVGYLVIVGSVGLFMTYLFVLRRWTASGASFSVLLMPLLTVSLGALLLDEPVRPLLLVGGAIVLAGTYVGALWQPRPVAPSSVVPGPPRTAVPVAASVVGPPTC